MIGEIGWFSIIILFAKMTRSLPLMKEKKMNFGPPPNALGSSFRPIFAYFWFIFAVDWLAALPRPGCGVPSGLSDALCASVRAKSATRLDRQIQGCGALINVHVRPQLPLGWNRDKSIHPIPACPPRTPSSEAQGGTN